MAKNSDELPKRDRAKAAERMAERRRADDRPSGFGDKEIGSGGRRTTTDGRPVGEGHPDGWQTGGRP